MFRYFILLLLALPLSAQEAMLREVADPGTDTHVEITALFSKPSPGGYLPVRVKIANNLKSDHSIRVAFKSNDNYNDELTAESAFGFTAQAGKTVTRDIMVPISPAGNGYGSSNTMVTATLSGSLGNRSSNTLTTEYVPNQPAVLLSEALYTPYASLLDSEINKRLSGGSRSSEFAAKFDPKQLPDDWLAFSGYDCVIMTDGDWTNIPPGARNAILSWVRLGGKLLVYSEGSATSASLGLPDEAGFGSINLSRMPATTSFATNAVSAVLKITNPKQASLRSDYSSSWPLQTAFGLKEFRYFLFVIVLIIFGILVGPVNLFVFAKAGQRHKLFITTPIISLAASVILIALIILQDGFGGRGVRRVLMEVRPDQGLNAAYVHQEQFCRTGVLTGSNFTIDTPVTLSPVQIASSRWARFTTGYGGAKGSFNLQPDDGKTVASGDWFQSRSEHGHILSAVISTRGRIEATDVPGTYLSTFEFPIDTLYLLDKSGEWKRANNVQAGKRFTFTSVDMSIVVPEIIKVANGFSKIHHSYFDAVRSRADHFIALTSHAPGIQTNPAVRWTRTDTVITGPIVLP